MAATKKKPAAKKKATKKAAAPTDTLPVLPLTILFTVLCLVFAVLAVAKY